MPPQTPADPPPPNARGNDPADLLTLPACDAPSAATLIEQVQRTLHGAGIAHRAPPPVPTSCCGRGCNGCVWEGYFGALQYWRDDAMAALSQHRAAPASPPDQPPGAP